MIEAEYELDGGCVCSCQHGVSVDGADHVASRDM